MKDYRENELKWYIFAYLFLLIGVNSPQLIVADGSDWFSSAEKLLSSSLLAGVICTLGFVLDCLYTAELKCKLIYLGITSLPGRTIFSRIRSGKINDMRIDVKTAQEKYGKIIIEIPTEEKKRRMYENTKWYNLSLLHEDDLRVQAAHRDYLLCRDLYTTTISMLLLTVIAMMISVLHFSWVLLGYLIVMLILTNIGAHVRAHRFVNSVIAVDMKLTKNENTQPAPAQIL